MQQTQVLRADGAVVFNNSAMYAPRREPFQKSTQKQSVEHFQTTRAQ